MNVHKNARMTRFGRLQLVHRIRQEGWTVAQAAEASSVSVRTAYKWLARYRAGGEPALCDRSSAPGHCPHRLAGETVAEIERLRRTRWTGPRISRATGVPLSTVGLVLRRLGLGRLRALDPRPPVIRYERKHPGEIIHIDTKKLGRINGPGHRMTGHRRGRKRGSGWEYLHVAIDDASRLAYTEVLASETGEACAGFMTRAARWFAACGVRIQRVMSDNAFAYTNSRLFKDALPSAPATSRRGPTPQGPTARPSASSRPRSENGSMPNPTTPPPTGPPTCHTGFIGTISTDPTAASTHPCLSG